MSYATVLAQIKSVLEGVSGIANVQDYLRWGATEAEVDAWAVSSSRLHTWWITRVATAENWDSTHHVLRRHTFRLQGVYALDDSAATEKTFQALIEDVMTAFRSKTTLNNVAELVLPPQLEDSSLLPWGGVLCHGARIRLVAEERVQAVPN